ncbi:MAG: hypothetical protein FJ297_16795 [Planctomycetes bacterium]|nr:hypothetical protein [Planctomycetota bacterium]
MAAANSASRIDLDSLRRAIQSVEPAALLIEPRILRRVIKQDRRLAGLGLQVPHRKTYTIQRDRLLVIADRGELALAPGDDLPRKVILLAHPTDGDYLEDAPAPDVLHAYWRLLFHARIHLAGEQRIAAGEWSDSEIRRRIEAIGTVAFAEIRQVLDKDDMLLPPSDDREAYLEFLAIYLELRYFAPKDLTHFFPAIRDWAAVDRLVSGDVEHERLHRESRLPGAAMLSPGARVLLEDDARRTSSADAITGRVLAAPSLFLRLAARAQRAGAIGNGVKALILRARALRVAPSDRAEEMEEAASAELERLVARLGETLDLPTELCTRWAAALKPLVRHAAEDRWSSEARLLYDLQKACVEHERGVYRIDIWGWLRSKCRNPLRKPLPLLRQVLITKHLRTSARRISNLRVDAPSRESLTRLIEDAFDRMEDRMRTDLRPLIAGVLDQEGLVPTTVAERVARRKIIEELLDRIVERGFVNMGDLRDALSMNNLKMPDLSGIEETLVGDQLLRSDRRLARDLEGVYRPGAIYLRVPQSLSSLAFGTPVGRFLTQFVVLPFGGAFLALSGLAHVVEGLVHVGTGIVLEGDGQLSAAVVESAAAEAARWAAAPISAGPLVFPAILQAALATESHEPSHHAWSWSFVVQVAALGTLMLPLIHRPDFRQRFVLALLRLFRLAHTLLIEWPTRIVRSPIVQRILQSQVYRVVHGYAIRPLAFSLIGLIPQMLDPDPWDWTYALNVFLGINLFLNSPIGRYADERFTDLMVRAWHELRMRVIAAVLQWIVDVFHQVLEAVERVLYIVDEWLRFRQGDPRPFLAVKAAFSPIWSAVRYVIRIYVTLLIEPQVNPIKHFPVVTVSHKILLPYSLILTRVFAAPIQPFLGTFLANAFAGATVLLLPGVFGFLVWELKENWRLYAANRSVHLKPSRIGHHGETMIRFLRPGFHSGTIPKLFRQLRKACRDAGETGEWNRVRRHKASLHHVEESLQRFFFREFCVLLEESGTLGIGTITLGDMRLATNRVEVALRAVPPPGAPAATGDAARGSDAALCLDFEYREGWLVASVHRRGWLDQLDPVERPVVEGALQGLYKISAVDLVLDRIELVFAGKAVTWELGEKAIVAYADRSRTAPIEIPLHRAKLRFLPQREEPQSDHWPANGSEPLIFSDAPIPWNRWVHFWDSEKRAAPSRSPIVAQGADRS